MCVFFFSYRVVHFLPSHHSPPILASVTTLDWPQAEELRLQWGLSACLNRRRYFLSDVCEPRWQERLPETIAGINTVLFRLRFLWTLCLGRCSLRSVHSPQGNLCSWSQDHIKKPAKFRLTNKKNSEKWGKGRPEQWVCLCSSPWRGESWDVLSPAETRPSMHSFTWLHPGETRVNTNLLSNPSLVETSYFIFIKTAIFSAHFSASYDELDLLYNTIRLQFT